MNDLYELARSVVFGADCEDEPVRVRKIDDGSIYVHRFEVAWHGSVAEWQTALLAALSAKFVDGTLVITADSESTEKERAESADRLSEYLNKPAVVMRENWKTFTVEERSDLLRMVTEFDQPNYAQLTDWVRVQPSGTSNLAVFQKDEQQPAVFRGDNDGKMLGYIVESELVETLASGREYSAVWLSRHADPSCESKIPRGVKVYRER